VTRDKCRSDSLHSQIVKLRYDNVTLSPLLLPARITNRSHSTYGSSARYLSPPLIFPTIYNGIRTKNRPVWITPGAAPIRWMGPIRNPRWEQKRTEGYVIVSKFNYLRVETITPTFVSCHTEVHLAWNDVFTI
jgi:hypothetical protein